MDFTRREWLTGTLGLTGTLAAAKASTVVGQLATDTASEATKRLPCVLSTWNFGQPANELALHMLQRGESLLDSVEQAIRIVEADAENSSVGTGGVPNAEGVVQLDACIMFGPGHRAGSVAGLEQFAHPISVARRVMEQTPHVMLVGEGAARFARDQGFAPANLLTDERRLAWEAWRAERTETSPPVPVGHDTIALVAVDANNTVAGGCSTSGVGYKLPGRIGDSPILGSGLYVDNEVGAAGATGVGENVMRFCGSFMIVEAMRHGFYPEDACVSAIRRIQRLDGRPFAELHINFIALHRDGVFGAAGTDPGFEYAVANAETSEVRQAKLVSD